MSHETVERLVQAVDWRALGADVSAVANAFTHLCQVQTKHDGERAYNEVLDTIAHNHSGWLHDAAGPAAPILVAIVRESDGWARETALEVLIECLSWARPEQRFVDRDGSTVSVRDAIQRAAASLEPSLQIWAVGRDGTVPISKAAADLLNVMNMNE